MTADERTDVAVLTAALDEVRELWKVAVADRADAIRLMSELVHRAPSAGDDEDGFIKGYILPTGPLHRIAAYLTMHGQSFPQSRSWAEAKSEHAQLRDELDAARATIQRVTALHTPDENGWCGQCSTSPCETNRLLGGGR